MSAAVRSPDSSEWRRLAGLGEQLVSATSLSAQHDRILNMASRLVDGEVNVWLDEGLFRLPGWDEAPLFPAKPPLDGLREAVERGRTCVRGADSASAPWVALPIEDQDIVLGALQVTRPDGSEFTPAELDLLEGLASIAAVGLYASHRAAVERLRLDQLNLVRQVAAEIVNVLDLDELARRVAEQIQKTFHFYYVAIFTLRPGDSLLRFRASATARRKGRRKASIPLEVQIGQGLIGEAAETGERLVADDVRADPRYRFIDSLPETRSEVVLPLKVKDRILGVLDVQSDQAAAFHPNDLLILETLADAIARAVEAARLYSDLRRRADQLALIAEVSDSVTSTLDLTKLMREAAALIHVKFGYPFVHLFTVHPNRRTIQYEAGSGKRSKKLEGYTLQLDEPQGIIPWVARNAQSVLANDVTRDERYRPSPLPPKNIRSELCVPLIFNERVVGLLDIQSERVNAFDEDDRMIFEAVADNIAAAIHNADLYRSEQWRRQVADSLREVAGLLSANASVDEVLDSILTELERNLPSEAAAVWLLDEGELYPAAVHGCCDLSELEEARNASADAAVSMLSSLLSETPVIRKPSDAVGPAGLAGGFPQNYSSIAVPLRVGDQPVGVLTLAHSMPGRYGHEAQAMTTTFASYAAVAIENARLYDQAQEQAYASAALLQIAQAVVSLNELNEILGAIVRIMPILVGVQRAALYLWQNEKFRAVDSYGFDEAAGKTLVEREFKRGDFPLMDIARDDLRTVIVPLRPKDLPARWPRLASLADEELDSALRGDQPLLIAVPLAIKSDLYGVLLVQEAPGGRRFRARRLEIINGIAQQAALAIQNDLLQKEMFVRERLETEVQLARQIQQTFIPETLPTHPEWELAARWRTARQVGGDFYDVFELPSQRLGLFIADVSDKGMPAALFMALTRTLVRAAVIETTSPAAALRRVNDLLVPDTRQGMFVTAVYAVLDLKTGELTYANAGHNPPFWVRKDTVEKLTRTGVALGAAEESRMDERVIRLEPGDSVFFYTDGLTEAFNPEDDMFGEERLLRVLGWETAASAESMLGAVETALDEFVGDFPASDDLTMLAVRRVSAS
ncbi:MAG: GAF domain-containing protein [Chloroflexota bacterium]